MFSPDVKLIVSFSYMGLTHTHTYFITCTCIHMLAHTYIHTYIHTRYNILYCYTYMGYK